MSHYDDLVAALDFLEDYLNAYSFYVFLAILLAHIIHAAYVACMVVGQACGVLLWLIVHST